MSISFINGFDDSNFLPPSTYSLWIGGYQKINKKWIKCPPPPKPLLTPNSITARSTSKLVDKSSEIKMGKLKSLFVPKKIPLSNSTEQKSIKKIQFGSSTADVGPKILLKKDKQISQKNSSEHWKIDYSGVENDFQKTMDDIWPKLVEREWEHQDKCYLLECFKKAFFGSIQNILKDKATNKLTAQEITVPEIENRLQTQLYKVLKDNKVLAVNQLHNNFKTTYLTFSNECRSNAIPLIFNTFMVRRVWNAWLVDNLPRLKV
jgi:hypothetical protein